MTTGITSPASALVTALNSLQKPMMLTPCWPSAGPTGGAGLAWPAGICNLICPVTFFAIKLCFLYLPILQFHRRIASKNVDGHFQLAARRVNFLDHAAEIQERSVINLNRFADFKVDLGPFGFLGRGNLGLDGVNFLRGRRLRRIAQETDDALC